ncbi:hypothetical protein [Heliophilum fasciatum]|uniref:Uncharacterized protein n=1 Tax=Heliophilum fasciatum TaxID=35700 RepID=A0A4R2RU96_9FIRM|nr:hypothetical protein [Heliophilum fasciatum]MCW2278593.1 hypothetical protein [Heliophilum fasciatum]TCP62705.1 hypothetical protein EDD73_11953 [Heliophilum fasciatum]
MTKKNNNQKKSKTASPSPLIGSPDSLLVILGLLSGALIVSSVIIKNDQTIQIVLDGSLARSKAGTSDDTPYELLR